MNGCVEKVHELFERIWLSLREIIPREGRNGKCMATVTTSCLLWLYSIYICLFLGGIVGIDFDCDFLSGASGTPSFGNGDGASGAASFADAGTVTDAY
jgi:hypothetical protein